ncbi:hypothetical protein Cni_G12414 [Canna indica]|uniref:Uncharacterized protein n=1 Tax=Canna indica TaxID=4628 RepID=A0AAQ3K9A5_9LILI|nr:hypothetical protein Cni_G12414 [Canna indica]
MEDVVRRHQVPAFGHWNFSFYDDETPISQYFESRFCGGDGGDLFKFEVLSPCKDEPRTKGKKGGKKMKYVEEKVRKAKAVDEDLYKIPPELLYQMPNKKKMKKNKNMLWTFCAGCLCLNCIA